MIQINSSFSPSMWQKMGENMTSLKKVITVHTTRRCDLLMTYNMYLIRQIEITAAY